MLGVHLWGPSGVQTVSPPVAVDMAKPRKPKLGSHLEWHGAIIRVKVRVPPSLQEAVGKAWLKESLPTAVPRDAEVLKWPVVARLKQQLGKSRAGRPDDPLIAEAFAWRAALHDDDAPPGQRTDSEEGLEARAERIARDEGSDRRNLFTAVATGVATPLNSLQDAWLQEGAYSPRAAEAYRHALRLLTKWCEEARVSSAIESITRKVAGRFVSEHFVAKGAHPATANKAIGGLRLYWAWMEKRGHVEVNPWTKQSMSNKDRDHRKNQREPGETDKRPFTDAEVSTLLVGLTDPLLGDFCRVAALTGMRRDEIAMLQVRHIQAGVIKVPGTKTAASVRDVPVHPNLTGLLIERARGKASEGFLFHELPVQTNPARGRGAPVTQAFTRKRRGLGVDDMLQGARQSRVDFHSWRRWFIRKAVGALEEGAAGFTAWTIADVVGHSNEDGPLAMTMGRYPGRADLRALRACVEAVRLPK